MRHEATSGDTLLGRSWILVAVTGLLTSVALTLVSSVALLGDGETVAGNSFGTGTVLLSDDDTGNALFNLTGLERGDSGNACIVVQYDGNLASEVRLYHQTGSGTLGDHLELLIEEGSGPDCAGFTGTTLYDGSLSDFATNHGDYSAGLGSFTPTTAGETTTFRFTYEIPSNGSAAAASSTATATLQWEARST